MHPKKILLLSIVSLSIIIPALSFEQPVSAVFSTLTVSLSPRYGLPLFTSTEQFGNGLSGQFTLALFKLDKPAAYDFFEYPVALKQIDEGKYMLLAGCVDRDNGESPDAGAVYIYTYTAEKINGCFKKNFVHQIRRQITTLEGRLRLVMIML